MSNYVDHLLTNVFVTVKLSRLDGRVFQGVIFIQGPRYTSGGPQYTPGPRYTPIPRYA